MGMFLRVLLILTMLASFAFFAMPARAQTTDPYADCFNDSMFTTLCPHAQAAMASLNAWASARAAFKQTQEPGFTWGGPCFLETLPPDGNGNAGYRGMVVGNNCTTGNGGTGTRRYPAGEMGPDCAEAPDLPSVAVRGGNPACNANCEYRPKTREPNDQSRPVNVGIGNGSNRYNGGSWEPTGNTCAVDNHEPHDPDKETCAPVAGAAYSECVKPDGSHCVTASSGRSLCWGVGQEGPRVSKDGKEGADRRKAPGIPTAPPTMENPNLQGTTNTSINNVNYTTNIYSGTGSTGQPNTGVPGDSNGDGEADEDDEGSVAGGADCTAPPVCQADPVDCYAVQEAWRLRCSGGDDPSISGVDQDFQHALDAMDDEFDIASFLGADGNGDLDSHRVTNQIDFDELDDSGFLGGSGSCPTFPIPTVGAVSLPIDMSRLCEILASVGQIVMALAYVVAIRIIATGGK